MKWYKSIFLSLLDMTVVNSLAVHKFLGGKMAQAEFKIELVRGLLQSGKNRGNKRNHLVPAPAAVEHMPVDTPFRRWRRCAVCWNNKGKRKETRIMCKICGVSLCPSPCFREFHITANAP